MRVCVDVRVRVHVCVFELGTHRERHIQRERHSEREAEIESGQGVERSRARDT